MNPDFTTISLRKATAEMITKIEEITGLKRAKIMEIAIEDFYQKAKRNHKLIKKLEADEKK